MSWLHLVFLLLSCSPQPALSAVPPGFVQCLVVSQTSLTGRKGSCGCLFYWDSHYPENLDLLQWFLFLQNNLLPLQFKDLLGIKRCCMLGSLCTEICNFASMFNWFKLVQIVGEKLWKPNLCEQSNFLLNAVGLGGWACSALELGFVGGGLHIPHFQAPGLSRTQALNVLISFVCAGKGAEATLGGLEKELCSSWSCSHV